MNATRRPYVAYDKMLAQRVHDLLGADPRLEERKMLGGIGFLVRGNMACGVLGDELIVPVALERFADILTEAHTHAFDSPGRSRSSWVMVGPAGYDSDADLYRWVSRGVTFARVWLLA